MDIGKEILAAVFSPVILFFLFGILTVLVKSDMQIPPAMSTALAIFLMVAIGLRGGVAVVGALRIAPGLLSAVALTAIWAVVCGVFFAFSTGNILKGVGLKTADAWAAGGSYGAVSSATLAVGVGIASAAQGASPDTLIFAGWMAAMYPFMDSPSLVTGILSGRMALARETADSGIKVETKKILHLTIFGMAVWLLVGSLIIGVVAKTFSPRDTESAMLLFDGMFRGVLALFLMDMGMVAGRQLQALKEIGKNLWKVILVAFFLPQVWALVGIFGVFGIHTLLPGMINWGDAFVFAAIAGGCSYVTAPVAMRMAIPEANPSVYLSMALALTFPFNIIVGMQFWRFVCMTLWGV